jgi:hypothetical protein
MYQVMIEKTADWLFPVMIGVGVWYGLHYSTLTPRVLMLDIPAEYGNFHVINDVPENVGKCIQENMASAILKSGRLEAALYTATFKHFDQKYKEKRLIAEASLDETCGVSQARQKQRAAEAIALEQEKLAAEKARMEALAKKKRQLEQEAQEQYQQQVKKQMNFFIDLLTGEK